MAITDTGGAAGRRALLHSFPALLLFAAGMAPAQVPRRIPDDSPSARLVFLSPVTVSVDRRPERVGPGVRVHDTRNRMVFMSQLVGTRALARYRRDAAGRIFEIWLLTPAEIDVARRLRQQQIRGR